MKKNKKILEIKTATLTSRGQISIPQDIRELSGFKEGEKVVIITYKDKIVLRPLKKFNNKI